jgi:dUTPase
MTSSNDTTQLISFYFTHPGAIIPTKSLYSDTFDLFSLFNVSINPFEVVTINTGVKCALPDGITGVVVGNPDLVKDSLVISGEIFVHDGEITVSASNMGFQTFWMPRDMAVAHLAIVKNVTPQYGVDHGGHGWSQVSRVIRDKRRSCE